MDHGSCAVVKPLSPKPYTVIWTPRDRSICRWRVRGAHARKSLAGLQLFARDASLRRGGAATGAYVHSFVRVLVCACVRVCVSACVRVCE